MTICLQLITIMIAHLLGSSSWAQDLVKVPVQIPAITPAVTAFAIARDRGYYLQEGLDVQLIVMPSAVGTQALLGGNVKFSTGGGAGCCQFCAVRRCVLCLPHSAGRCFGSIHGRSSAL